MHARFLSLTLLLACFVSCGGSSAPTTTTGGTTSPAVLAIGGTYPTTATLAQSSCPSVTVMNNTTTITHTAGASMLVLSHAGNDYQGTVTSQGKFTTQAKTESGGGENHTLTIAGQFTAAGFTATVSADVTRQTAPTACAYTVTWTATKSGSGNTFP